MMRLNTVRYGLTFIFILTFLTFTSAHSGAQSASDTRTFLNIRYDQIAGVDPDLLSVDVYTSTEADGWPVMVYVHGGAWQGGDKSNVFAKPDYFVGEGYVFVSVNYRLSPRADFPAHAQDVGHAVASVMDNIGRYGGDGDQVYLMGHSAGAHLVVLVATDESYLTAHGKSLSDLRGVISNDTRAYDIVALAEENGGVLPDAYVLPFGDDPTLWEMASPITHITPDKDIPPMMMLYSGTNPSRFMAADGFAKALDAAGIVAEVLGSPSQNHSEINREMGTPSDPVTEAVMRFLQDVSAP